MWISRFTRSSSRLALTRPARWEDRGGYRLFYMDGRPIERESDVHVMFDLVWLGSPSDVNREVNNGRGPADFTVSRGAHDKTVIEFKLASNSQLKRNLEKQAEIYQKGACCRRDQRTRRDLQPMRGIFPLSASRPQFQGPDCYTYE
ncbi:MAG TPA: hypothetical protein VGB13_05175 [Candidatus Krumholzibacteria bacterium]